jgi:ABC-type phosphate transport system substrate-binding protein
MIFRSVFITVILLLGFPLSAEGVFIAHLENNSGALTQADISEILLGRKATWDNGTRIIIYTIDENESEVTSAIFKTYIRKAPAQFLAYWKRQVFTGKGAMPKVVMSDAEMIANVAKSPGAFGYIDRTSLTDAVRLIEIR